jgi:hypothetical protein
MFHLRVQSPSNILLVLALVRRQVIKSFLKAASNCSSLFPK